MIPGAPKTNMDLPRLPGEIKHASASFEVRGCAVKSDGARVEITFPGLNMGIFSGDLRFTIYRGSNLLRLEAIAKPGSNRSRTNILAGFEKSGDS